MGDTATADSEDRQLRRYDLEAERRARRRFTLMVAGFAILAIAGGMLAAYWVLWDAPAERTPPPRAPKPPPQVEALAPQEPVAFDDDDQPVPAKVTRPPRKMAQSLGDGALRNGLARLQSAFNACARKHGAIQDTVIRLDFTVEPSGGVEQGHARPPHSRTPLGLCVVSVLKSKGRFARTREGRRDIRRSVTLHP